MLNQPLGNELNYDWSPTVYTNSTYTYTYPYTNTYYTSSTNALTVPYQSHTVPSHNLNIPPNWSGSQPMDEHPDSIKSQAANISVLQTRLQYLREVTENLGDGLTGKDAIYLADLLFFIREAQEAILKLKNCE